MNDKAISAYGVSNLIGGCVFHTIGLLTLANGSTMGVALGAVWITGSFTNNFLYYGAHRRLLWPCLAPGIAAAIAGPLIAYGPGLNAAIVACPILLMLAAGRSYALDRRAVQWSDGRVPAPPRRQPSGP